MFAPITLDGDPAPLLAALTAGIEAVEPRRAAAAAIQRRGRQLIAGGEATPLPERPVRVLALGKAAVGMCWGLADVLDGVPLAGVAATPVPQPPPPGIEVVRGGHPVPDRKSLAAGERLLAEALAAGEDDLVVVLVSGGGSACAESPVAGVGAASLAALNRLLLASGAPIDEINTVRRALSLLKGGGLAAAAAPARVVTVVISDVVGNHLPTIAGGPTVPSPTGPGDAREVLARRGLLDAAGPEIRAALVRRPDAPPPGAGGTVVIAADGALAAAAAAEAARRAGIEAVVAGVSVTGEAAAVGRVLAERAAALEPNHMEVSAGETTVRIEEGGGRGGRNQEVAVAAAVALEGAGGAVVASLGTDGVDGPTDAAGGVADGGTTARGREAGVDAAAALAAHDSGTYLEAVDGRLVCGPSGTNVGDLLVAWHHA